MTRTQKLGLCTWLPEDPVCLAEVNDNFSRLDTSGARALRQAEAQADTERQAMLAHTEEDCQALREAALGRMDGAVAYLLEKVVKR